MHKCVGDARILELEVITKLNTSVHCRIVNATVTATNWYKVACELFQ